MAEIPASQASMETPEQAAYLDEIARLLTEVKAVESRAKWQSEAITELCKLSDHDMCIICKAVFLKSKPEPRCGCVKVDANGRVHEA